MRYRYLVLDHDDTSVESSATIHYPAHVEVMRKMRPDLTPITLEMWFQKNSHPGIMEYFQNELEFSEDEIAEEYRLWRQFASKKVPDFYPGFVDALIRYQRAGGRIAVVSHSDSDIIKRDYTHADISEQYHPELIYGWDSDPAMRKPNPYPVLEIMKAFGADRDEVLVVDDLKPGIEMAMAAGVDAAAAGWAHSVDEIQRYMMQTCVGYFRNVAEFGSFILS